MDRGKEDCYFYYYSKCEKPRCLFRHEPSALGCETTCSKWKSGNCKNEFCSFRHMEMKKNRKAIPCYWERQPSGCTKPHCPFMHMNTRSNTNNTESSTKSTPGTTESGNQDWMNRRDDSKFDNTATESNQGRGSSDAGSYIGSPAVDAVIVNFEEDSEEAQMEEAEVYSFNISSESCLISPKPQYFCTTSRRSYKQREMAYFNSHIPSASSRSNFTSKFLSSSEEEEEDVVTRQLKRMRRDSSSLDDADKSSLPLQSSKSLSEKCQKTFKPVKLNRTAFKKKDEMCTSEKRVTSEGPTNKNIVLASEDEILKDIDSLIEEF